MKINRGGIRITDIITDYILSVVLAAQASAASSIRIRRVLHCHARNLLRQRLGFQVTPVHVDPSPHAGRQALSQR